MLFHLLYLLMARLLAGWRCSPVPEEGQELVEQLARQNPRRSRPAACTSWASPRTLRFRRAISYIPEGLGEDDGAAVLDGNAAALLGL